MTRLVIASQVLVPTMSGAMIPLGQVAHVQVTQGPPSIRTENAQPVAYIYVDLHGRDLGGYVAEAARAVAQQVKLPPGYHIEWSGQFEYLQRAEAKLRVVVPATLLVIFVLLYLNFGRLTETLIVMLSVPFALVGGAWLMWWLGYNMSVAVAVGFHRACRRRRRDRRRHADLSRPRPQMNGSPAAQRDGRALMRWDVHRRDHRRRGRARAPEDDDGHCYHGRLAADPVERRHGVGSDAAHRRADGRRHAVLDLPHPDRHSRDLCLREAPHRPL